MGRKKEVTPAERKQQSDTLKKHLDNIKKKGFSFVPRKKPDNNNASLGYAGRYLQSK
jgi:hypothetical protein